jgi:tetratricopeptide (TPR) repeat protein
MNKIVDIAKKVLRKAVGIGIDLAGEAICTPKLWDFFKKVLAPVFKELEQKYPRLFLKPKEADPEEAEKAIGELEKNKRLIDLISSKFDHEFGALKEGQDEISALLIGVEKTVIDISTTVKDIGEELNSADLKTLKLKIDEIHKMMVTPPVEPSLSSEEIDREVRALQTDAMRWIQGRISHSAQRRLTEARRLIANGIERDPQNANLYVLRGYIEKTQSQVDTLEGRHELAITHIGDAAKYFGAALKLDTNNVEALNGMANVFLNAKYYETAIKLGRIVVKKAPEFASGAWDLALSIEKKIKQDGQTTVLVEELKSLYRVLLQLIPRPGSGFSSSNLYYVQSRLKHWEDFG